MKLVLQHRIVWKKRVIVCQHQSKILTQNYELTVDVINLEILVIENQNVGTTLLINTQ